MKAAELRIGNFVDVSESNDSYYAEVVSIDCWGIVKYDNQRFETVSQAWMIIEEGVYNIKPIPLTEEWLFKFGFQSEQPYRFTKGHNDYSYCLESRGRAGFKDGGYFMGIRYDDWAQDPHTIQRFTYDVKHVHELQNLYFALTGEELTPHNQEQQNQDNG